jgi:DNA polymerase IIIc chi subunit
MAQCILGFIINHNDIKNGTAWKIQIKVSHVEFQQNLKDDLRDTIKVLRKMDFIISQYVTK